MFNEKLFQLFPTFEIFLKKYWKETHGNVVCQSRNPIRCPLGARKRLRDRQARGQTLPVYTDQDKGQRHHVEVLSSHSCTVDRILLVTVWDSFWKHVTSTSVLCDEGRGR